MFANSGLIVGGTGDPSVRYTAQYTHFLAIMSSRSEGSRGHHPTVSFPNGGGTAKEIISNYYGAPGSDRSGIHFGAFEIECGIGTAVNMNPMGGNGNNVFCVIPLE